MLALLHGALDTWKRYTRVASSVCGCGMLQRFANTVLSTTCGAWVTTKPTQLCCSRLALLIALRVGACVHAHTRVWSAW